MTWCDETGEDPSRLPIVLLQPTVRLKENFGFARNALWALFQFHPWSDRREPFLTLDANGEPLDKEFVKQ